MIHCHDVYINIHLVPDIYILCYVFLQFQLLKDIGRVFKVFLYNSSLFRMRGEYFFTIPACLGCWVSIFLQCRPLSDDRWVLSIASFFYNSNLFRMMGENCKIFLQFQTLWDNCWMLSIVRFFYNSNLFRFMGEYSKFFLQFQPL
jgi:hypothetical protein